jgi:hypothetical protein
MNQFISKCLLICSTVGCAAPTLAQSIQIDWFTTDGGGVSLASGGPYSLGGTSGQPDAGLLNGGPYEMTGGFWSLPAPPEECGRLSIQIVGGTVEVSWPAGTTGCVLEECEALGGTPQWTPVTPAPTGTVHAVSVLDGSRFYRLRKP